MFNAWYEPGVHMTLEEWTYIAYLAASWILSIGLGLLIGSIISR